MKGEGTCINEDLIIEGETYKVTCLSMGNPHCVIFVDNVDDYPVERIGPIVEKHEAFPKRVNVGFAQVLNKDEMKLRVWKGCGKLFSVWNRHLCGGGSSKCTQKVGNKVTVHLRGGTLR